jgi:hypothetical protein
MRVLFVRVTIASAIVLIALAARGYAQETTGTIVGAVRSETGAILAGVEVVIVNAATGSVQRTVTGSAGDYTASLPVGRYEIIFRPADGQPTTVRGISVHVNDRLPVDAIVTIGAQEPSAVTVERRVQPVAAVHHLIEPGALQELPLLTRTWIPLVALAPGLSSDLREDACFCDQGVLDISINGSRRSAVNWLVDGASNVNLWNNYTLVTTPSLDAIQEIDVIVSTYAAESAHNGGGVVNVVTRSGTNRFSGSAYHFLRNDALNANTFFRNMDPRPQINSMPTPLRYNNFGYTLGGPALPAHRKLFFFFSQEWRRSSSDQRPVEQAVPDPAWLTNSASPNYVPMDARDANAVKLLALWPAPNVAETNRYRTMMTNGLDTRQELVRSDYNAGSTWSLTGRYLRDSIDSRDPASGHREAVGRMTAGEARRAGSRLSYELWHHFSSHDLSRRDRVDTRDNLAIAIREIFPENAANLVPNISVAGLTPLAGRQPAPREYRNHTVGSALTLQHGRHTIKTGGRFAIEHVNSNLFAETTQGAFQFQAGGGFTAFQNFLRGNATGTCGDRCTYSETDIDVVNRFRSDRYELFAQDAWRIHPRVTLDLGLRYAFYRPLTDDRDMLFTFSPDAYDRAKAPAFADPDGDFVVLGTGNLFNGILVAGEDSPFGRAIYAADTNNLQPRLAAAWDPQGRGRLMLRAGYGMYFDQQQVGMFAENVQSSYYDPYRTELFIANARLSNPAGGTVITPFAVPTPQTLATSDQLVAPRWQHWNAGAQQRLYGRGTIDIGYIGSRGDHLLRYVDLNRPQPATFAERPGSPNLVRPFPGYDAIVMRETSARSRYHALASSFRHEAGRAGSATVSYTVGRNTADATYDNDAVDAPQNPLDKDRESGAAGTDRTHIFTASYIYELPFARRTTSRWRRYLLHGWQVAGITTIESGPAARLRVVNCNYGGSCFPGMLRPDQVRDPEAGDQTGLLWFDPAGFVPSAAGAYGNAPVAPFRLPGRHQWDIAVSKRFRVAGTTGVQIRADLINAFNQTQFRDVNTQCLGTTTCDPRARFGQVTSARPAREIQVGVRLDWSQ